MTAGDAPLLIRLWRYQMERFPLVAHGALTLALAAAAAFFAAGVSGGRPSVASIAAGFSLAFLQFLLLRIADEHKDIDEDAAHRPYRPVPRGLVSLSELRRLALAAYVLQFLVLTTAEAAWPFLAWSGVQLYFAAMTAEFLAPQRLGRSPVLTLLSHMPILPLIAWLAAAPTLAELNAPPQSGAIVAFALAGVGVFGLGAALEIARKIRTPEAEEEGVQTYSQLWGRRNAVIALLGACGLAVLALAAAAYAAGAWWAAAVPVFGLTALIVFARPLSGPEPPETAGERLDRGTRFFGLTWLAGLGLAGAFAAAPA